MSEIKSGVYIIRNKVDERCYIGSAINFNARESLHFSQLKRKNHHCIHLQNFANKYGIDKLYFEVLEYVEDKNNLIVREQFYLDNTTNKFNSSPTAGSNLGYKYTNEQINKRTKSIKEANKKEETKIKRSIASKNIWANHHDKMRKAISKAYQNKELLEKVAKSKYKKVYQYSLDRTQFINEYEGIKVASLVTNICQKKISNVAIGTVKQAGGFYWSFKRLDESNIKPFIVKRNDNRVPKIVYQYNLEKTKLIAVYKSVKEVSIKFNINENSIRQCINGHNKSSCGFFWSYTPLYIPTKSKKKKHTIQNQLYLF